MKPDVDVPALYETAAAWFTRQQAAEDWSAEAAAELQAWLQADPRHHRAYREIAETWRAFDHVPRPVLASDARRASGIPDGSRASDKQPARKPARSRSGWRRAFFGSRLAMTATCACLALLVCGWYWHDNTPQFSSLIQTAHAEQQEVTLPDTSVLTVNGNSRLAVRFYPRRREVQLAQGEAFFDVAPSSGKAFVVETGNTRVSVTGTAFNVRTGQPGVYVKVRNGSVEVSSQGDRGTYTERLGAGDAVRVDKVTGAQRRLPSAPDVAGSWRSGQLVFRNASLYEVADELGGYLGQPIELVGREIGHRRLSGFASTRDPQSFLNALPQLLQVDVQALAGGGYRIVKR